MHVAVVLQHYHTPDCPTAARPHALVKRLSASFEVTLVTSSAWRAQRHSHRLPWVPPGVRLVEVDVPYANAMGIGARLRAFASFAGRAFLHLLRIPQPDVILASSTPLTAVAAARAAAGCRGVPWIFEVRDLWPDFPVQMGALPHPALQAPLYALEHHLYRHADHIVTLSPDMERHVRATVPRAAVSTNLYGSDHARLNALPPDAGPALRRRLHLPNDAFVVLYAGSFGRANGIPTLLRTAERLRTCKATSRIVLMLAGDGYYAPDVEQAARAHANVVRIPPLPYDDSLALFRAADVSLVSFIDRPVLQTNAPQKFADSLSAGTPVVVMHDGWTRRLVEAEGCGWFVPAEAPGALAERLTALAHAPEAVRTAARRAATAGRAHFNRTAWMDRYADRVAAVGRLATP